MSQEEKDLEQAIREKLEQYRPSSPLNWERMEQRLQAEADKQAQETTEAFDESIRDKIAESRVAFNPAHWRLLSAQLEAREQWLANLYRSKAVELTLMLLLFLTIFNFSPVVPTQAIVAQSKVQNKVQNNTTNSNVAQISTLDYPIDTYHLQEKETTNIVAKREQVQTYSNVKFVAPILVSNTEIKENKNEVEPHLTNISTSENAPFFGEIDVREIIFPKSAITSLPILPVVAKTRKPTNQVPKIRVPCVYAFVGSVQHYGQLNRIKIQNGSNNIFSTDSKYTLNQGVAMNLGIANKNNQISTGLSFDELKFDSETKTVFQDGSVRIRSKQVTLQTFAVPLSFTHTFGNRRLSPFVQAGMSAHFITKAKYDYRNIPFARTSALPPFAQPIVLLPHGLMNGGSLVSNAYLTVDLGIGASYKMTKHLSLMGQMQYRHFMFNNGFGPNDNRINQLQMATGIQFRY